MLASLRKILFFDLVGSVKVTVTMVTIVKNLKRDGLFDLDYRFWPWLGSLCCALEEDTSLSQCLSPPRCLMGTGNPTIKPNPSHLMTRNRQYQTTWRRCFYPRSYLSFVSFHKICCTSCSKFKVIRTGGGKATRLHRTMIKGGKVKFPKIITKPQERWTASVLSHPARGTRTILIG